MQIDLIKAPTEADWALVKACTLVTVGKKATTPPTSEWKHRILEARHSPIRELRFVFRLEVPYWVAMHLVRHHVGCQPYVRTQRNGGKCHEFTPCGQQDLLVRGNGL